MRPGDHTDVIRRLAVEFGRAESDVLELFLERSAIREHDGSMPRGAAEEWAVEDCRAYFAMRASVPRKAASLPSDESNRLLPSAPRDSQTQLTSASKGVAGASR